MKDQPRPADMLEELGDKVIGHMDRLAVTSFRDALDEMIDFHRFLIEAYETHDDRGKPDSYAQMGDWQSMHVDWIRGYSRLFERAARYIGQENDFASSLVYVPYRLLPDNALQHSNATTVEVLDGINIFIHRIEDWLTQKSTHEQVEIERSAAHVLAGSDKKAYTGVVMSLVGAWENTLGLVGSIYKWQRDGIEKAEKWSRFCASWPFLQRHLNNSAYLLAVAVWNEDEIGADHYSEMLLRWFERIVHELEDDYHLTKTLLTPDLFSDDWETVLEKLSPMMLHPGLSEPVPAGVFSAIIQNTMRDVIVIVAAIMEGWFLSKKQQTDIAPRTVARLLSRSVDDDSLADQRAISFPELMLQFVRLETVSGRFASEGYGAWLDSVISSLDRMAERPIVSGRVFTPSTKHRRDDLHGVFLVFLLSRLGSDDGEIAIKAVSELTSRSDLFGERDASIRSLLYELRQLVSMLSQDQTGFYRKGVASLSPEILIGNASEKLISILERTISEIDQSRKERLLSLDVQKDKISSLSNKVDRGILSDNSLLPIFNGIRHDKSHEYFSSYTFTFNGIEKGYFTSPEMVQRSGNFDDYIKNGITGYIQRVFWYEFANLSQSVIEVETEEAFTAGVKSRADQIFREGGRPVLLVCGWRDPSWIGKWFSWTSKPTAGLEVKRREDMETNLYIGTVNDIDVFRFRIKPNHALLFNSDLLESLTFGANEEGAITEAEFIPDETGLSGALNFNFNLKINWREREIFAFHYPSSDADNEY